MITSCNLQLYTFNTIFGMLYLAIFIFQTGLRYFYQSPITYEDSEVRILNLIKYGSENCNGFDQRVFAYLQLLKFYD